MYNSVHQASTEIADDLDEIWPSEAQQTGEIFSGTPAVRPRLDFGSSSKRENARTCRKNYTKSETHSPGIFTVQCVCSHPKIIGVAVMEECEGVPRFATLPMVCYYDNACKLLRSVVLTCPWVNEKCTIMCDRFHYASHTCNSICEPSSYRSCSMHATSGAESLKHL